MTVNRRAAGLVLGVAFDTLLGDPRSGHPVAGLGRFAGRLERRMWRDSKTAGATFVAAVIVPAVTVGVAAERAVAYRGGARVIVLALAAWTVLGGRSLRRIAATIGERLTEGDLAAARAMLPALCGRNPDALDAAGLARAVVESVAENTSDAVIGPLFWGAVAGVPGLLGYRAVNTLDAMVGHRTPRYRRFGWASARLDDAMNLVPARLTGGCTLLAAGTVAGRASDGWRSWRRDAAAHPSPNAGVCEAAAAGVLGLRLGGTTLYGTVAESRPVLGDGSVPAPQDIARAVRLSAATQAAALAVVLLVAGARR